MGKAVGENLRRVRQQHRETQVEAAHRLGRHGLDWTRQHLNNVETGRRPVMELNVLWLLSYAYGVPLAEWFAGEGEVWLSETVSTQRARIREVLPKDVGALTVHGDLVTMLTDEMRAGADAATVADDAVALRLGIPSDAVQAAARLLWGRTVTQERDSRLGDVADLTARSLQARRGAMTRQLTGEIRAALNGTAG